MEKLNAWLLRHTALLEFGCESKLQIADLIDKQILIVVRYFTGWIGDKYHIRGPIIILNAIIAIIGLPIMGWVDSVGVRYFGVFLVCMGVSLKMEHSCRSND